MQDRSGALFLVQTLPKIQYAEDQEDNQKNPREGTEDSPTGQRAAVITHHRNHHPLSRNGSSISMLLSYSRLIVGRRQINYLAIAELKRANSKNKAANINAMTNGAASDT
jgi:hypothetical protein